MLLAIDFVYDLTWPLCAVLTVFIFIITPTIVSIIIIAIVFMAIIIIPSYTVMLIHIVNGHLFIFCVHTSREPVDTAMVLHSAFVLVKHKVVPMDLVAVHLPDRTLFSFLSITWGIMADIDYETEKYRNLGETRFTVGAVVGILGKF